MQGVCDVDVETLLSSPERARDKGRWATVRRSWIAMRQNGKEFSATAGRIVKSAIRGALPATRAQLQVCSCDLSIRCSMRAQPSQLIAMHGILFIA